MNVTRSPRGGRLIAAAILVLGSLSPAFSNEPAPSAVESSASRIKASSTNISEYAEILHDGSNWTLIPHGCVLHLPKKYRSRIGGRPVGNLVSWREFCSINSSWILSEKITLRQAEGSKPIDQRRLSYFKKQDRMVVAVHENGPIRVVRTH